MYAIWVALMSLSFRFVAVANLSLLFDSVYEAARYPVSAYRRRSVFCRLPHSRRLDDHDPRLCTDRPHRDRHGHRGERRRGDRAGARAITLARGDQTLHECRGMNGRRATHASPLRAAVRAKERRHVARASEQ